jgi:DNA helicase II / ATP-dependent DNA helicase PcrA
MSVRDLNPPQRSAVRTLSGPLLVLAGAGTGKTRVITYRIARLIEHGVRPSRILAVTFTNKAAREMKQRATALLGKRRRKAETPEISTFHSLCVRILRRHAPRLGYPAEFSIYDRGDQESVARAALRDIRVGQEKLRPGDLLALIGGWKTHSVRPERAGELAENDKQQLAALAYVRYQAALKASGALDFDDLLLCTEELFEKHADVRVAEAGRFDHLLIDEYQDTNALQYRIVRALAERHRNLCVVGDDDQSIYGWRGAEVAHILSFEREWPDSKVVRLEDNYRSRAPILALANTLIAHNSARHDKLLRAYRGEGFPPRFVRFENETEEAEGIVGEIERRLDPEGNERSKASDLAILFRTNEQPRAFELELRRRRIPYQLVGGQSFYDRKEIKDLLAYLKVLGNPADEVSLLRIINTPARGIGNTSVQIVLERAVAAGVPLWTVLPTAGDDGSIPHAASQRISAFRDLIERYRARLGTEPLVGIVGDLIREIAYRAELERIYKTPGDVEARWQTIEELVNSVALYESRQQEPTLLGFLEETALAGREDQRDDQDDKRTQHAVTLMTLHSAKGLEFPHVYMVGMEEGLLPHQRSVADGSRNIDEERRLCYVGVTRAQDSLSLSFCRSRMKWGKAQPAIPSRFLMEMRGETERARRAAAAAEKLFGAQPVTDSKPASEPEARPARKTATARRRRAPAVDRARGRHED